MSWSFGTRSTCIITCQLPPPNTGGLCPVTIFTKKITGRGNPFVDDQHRDKISHFSEQKHVPDTCFQRFRLVLAVWKCVYSTPFPSMSFKKLSIWTCFWHLHLHSSLERSGSWREDVRITRAPLTQWFGAQRGVISELAITLLDLYPGFFFWCCLMTPKPSTKKIHENRGHTFKLHMVFSHLESEPSNSIRMDFFFHLVWSSISVQKPTANRPPKGSYFFSLLFAQLRKSAALCYCDTRIFAFFY